MVNDFSRLHKDFEVAAQLITQRRVREIAANISTDVVVLPDGGYSAVDQYIVAQMPCSPRPAKMLIENKIYHSKEGVEGWGGYFIKADKWLNIKAYADKYKEVLPHTHIVYICHSVVERRSYVWVLDDRLINSCTKRWQKSNYYELSANQAETIKEVYLLPISKAKYIFEHTETETIKLTHLCSFKTQLQRASKSA